MNTTETPDVTFAQALRVLRRRWPLAVFCFVLVAASAVAFSLLQEKQYTATAELLFRDPGFDQQLFGNSFFVPNQDPTQAAATNKQLVALPVVAARTAKAIGGLSQGLVSREVSIAPVGQANIVEISVTDPSPVRAARIANTYATQYVLFRQKSDRDTIQGAEQLLQTELTKLTPAQRSTPQGLSLSNRAQQLQILASLQTGNAEFVQPAAVPNGPSIPKTKRNGVLGGIFGLLLGVGLVFLLDRLDRRIRNADDLEETFGVPVLGVVPESAAYALTPTAAPLPHIEAEAFAMLRARLRYFNVDRDLRTLLITSAAPQDGKSTTSLNLALAEAAAGGRKILLVEADLRRPTLAKRLGVARSPGLAEVLSGFVELDEALREVPVYGPREGAGLGANLSVLTAGEVPPNPGELIESHAMVELLTLLSERFDVVFLDSPPANSVSDAMHLMRLVNGVLIVSRVGKNTRDMARYLGNQLRQLHAPVLGVIANGVSFSDRSYEGYAYYGTYAYTGDGAAAPGSMGGLEGGEENRERAAASAENGDADGREQTEDASENEAMPSPHS